MNPYLIIGALVGAIALTFGGWYAGHHGEEQVFNAYKATQAAAAEKQVATNVTAVAAISASEADGLKQIAATAQESRNEIQKRNDALVGSNAALSGTVASLQRRLASASQQLAGVPETAAGRPDDNAAGDPALSIGLADLVKFNSAEFYAADQYAVNLTAAQQVIVQDRLICNGALPGLN